MNGAENNDWNRVTTKSLVGFAAGMGVFMLLVLKSEPGFVFLLDHANLLFHEAGHPALGLVSRRLEVYGGTLGQLVFPAVLAVSFCRRRETLSFAASAVWFFENWLNIARYMADARAQVLPLVGGGEHDWANIFGRWGVLTYDTRIAALTRAIGWLGMCAACIWVLWQWWKRTKEPYLAETGRGGAGVFLNRRPLTDAEIQNQIQLDIANTSRSKLPGRNRL